VLVGPGARVGVGERDHVTCFEGALEDALLLEQRPERDRGPGTEVPTERQRSVLPGQKGGLARPALRDPGNIQRGVQREGQRARTGHFGLGERGKSLCQQGAQERKPRDQKRVPGRIVGPDADAVQKEEDDPCVS
jgi:hypothetical protein